MEHELGDVFFALANLARHLNIAPEDAMRAANRRFTTRFHVVEKGLEAQGVAFGEALARADERPVGSGQGGRRRPASS